MLGAALTMGVGGVVFYCAFAHSFIRASRVWHQVSCASRVCALDSGIEPAGWLTDIKKRGRNKACHGWALSTSLKISGFDVRTPSGRRNLLPDKKRKKADFESL